VNGWGSSKGTKHEVSVATVKGIPVFDGEASNFRSDFVEWIDR